MQQSVVIGLVLGLSSTAFALQTLAERKELHVQHGRAAFSILLFQDMAVVPLLAVLPWIASASIAQVADEAANMSETQWLQIGFRSEEHTSELQSLMRISYAVFCLKKKTNHNYQTAPQQIKQHT